MRERLRRKYLKGTNNSSTTGTSLYTSRQSYYSSKSLKSASTSNNSSTITDSKRLSNSSWTDDSSDMTLRSSERESRCSGEFLWRFVLNQRIYYCAGLLFNGLLLSFYSVMTFTEHVPCLPPQQKMTNGSPAGNAYASKENNHIILSRQRSALNKSPDERKSTIPNSTVTLKNISSLAVNSFV